MKAIPALVFGLALVTIVLISGCIQQPASPYAVPVPAVNPGISQQPALSGPVAPTLQPVASFEGGQRYQAGPYIVIVLNGSYTEMGRQYGGLMKTELSAEYAFLINTLTQRGYTTGQVLQIAKGDISGRPKCLDEITLGMAETSGLTPDNLDILYDGGILFMYYNGPGKSGCSYLATWGSYTKDGSVIVSRNLDLPDSMSAFDPYNVLAIYRPNDGSKGVATFGPAGTRPETRMNSAGLFIADDAVIFPDDTGIDNRRPPLVSEFFQFMLDYPTLASLDTGIRATQPDGAYIVDAAGPDGACVYEETVAQKIRRSRDGVVAASNHFIDPAWHLTGTPPANSVARYNNLLTQAGKARGSIDAAKTMQIRDVLLQNGGATFQHDNLGEKYSSVHQVVFVPGTRTLWVKAVDNVWQEVELGPLFGS